MRARRPLALALLAALVLASPRGTGAYPGGTPDYPTDAAPFCAGCHSVADKRYHRTEPAEVADQEFVEKKHYRAILDGEEPYDGLSPEERKRLVEDLRKLDANTRIALEAPKTAKPGETVRVVARTTGGAGPAVGVMLLDADLRYQARTLASSGWYVDGAPRITGPDGKLQTAWTDKRAPEVGRNLAYVNVSGIASSVEKGAYPSASVEWTLLAPRRPGKYAVAAAMLYGSEKATALGAVKSVRGVKPLGGFGGASGRILFTEPAVVEVK